MEKFHILLVDDDPAARRVLKDFLQESYKISESSNGLEAWKILQNGHNVDLLITDFEMPYMNGIELASSVRRLKHPIPIVLISGRSEELKTQKLPIDELIGKPIMGYRSFLTRIASLLKDSSQ